MQLIEIVMHTPWWVWVLLAYLIYSGVSLLSPNETSLWRMLLMPCIFLLWGIYGIFSKLHMPWTALLIYVAALIAGLFLGKFIMAKRRPAVLDAATGMVQRPGSKVPLVVVLFSFSCLYIVNVYAAYHPESPAELKFVVIYSLASGLAAGVFLGISIAGIMKALLGTVVRVGT